MISSQHTHQRQQKRVGAELKTQLTIQEILLAKTRIGFLN